MKHTVFHRGLFGLLLFVILLVPMALRPATISSAPTDTYATNPGASGQAHPCSRPPIGLAGRVWPN